MRYYIFNYDKYAKEEIDLTEERKNSILKMSKQTMLENCHAFYKVFLNPADKCFLKTDIAFVGLDIYKECQLLFMPCIVNGALVAELALKYISYLIKNTFILTHDLKMLFDDLPQKQKEQLELELGKFERIKGRSLYDGIDLLRSNFEKFRYEFEFKESYEVDIFFKAFVCTICNYALSLKEVE